ncbi:MAG: hypothetical protein KF790_08090 [Steroidobacteraceae bacterium]|nr:hypothetical protein [Steroidobacteraceae bacterium]MCW5573196.1 hypothetical protein [Steroidobacteraceae bacterium]
MTAPLQPTFDRLRVSKELSRVASATVEEILHGAGAEPERSRRMRVIGITGAPGVGKSTLIGRLARSRLKGARSLAIVAIDPTSPCTRGSLLGDRIRMEDLGEDPRVFIRSLPSGTSEDGLTDNVAEVLDVLEGSGFDEALLETVGVGQTAQGVRTLADVEVLVLAPGAGDHIQAMKAGVMETADIHVVNKAEQPGAERLVAEVLGVRRRARAGASAAATVIQVRAGESTGVEQLSAALDERLAAGAAVDMQRVRQRYRVQQLVQRRLQETLDQLPVTTWDASLPDNYLAVLRRLHAEARQFNPSK